MARRTSAGRAADMMNLEGDERRRYLAAQRKRVQRAREHQAGFVEVAVPAHHADELRRIAEAMGWEEIGRWAVPPPPPSQPAATGPHPPWPGALGADPAVRPSV